MLFMEIRMKNFLLLVAFLNLSGVAVAELPPTNCVVGRATGSESGGWSKLELYSPQYVVAGEPAKYSVSGPELLGSDSDDAQIKSMYEGNHGVITLDFWSGEGSKDITLNTPGKTWVWAFHKTRCSTDEVYVHKKTVLNKVDFDGAARAATLSYEVFPFSRAYVENIPPKITIKWKEDVYGTYGTSAEMELDSLQGVVTLKDLKLGGPGLYKLEARIYDGVYFTTLQIGSILVKGIPKPPCAKCKPL
jgi:hypothetical protein